MNKLDYSIQLNSLPIALPIGNIRKPTLNDISHISFERFNFYQVFLKIEPRFYYEEIAIDKTFWESLNDKQKDELTMYQVILNDERVRGIYIDLFNFFFLERVTFKEGFFVLIKNFAKDKDEDDLQIEDLAGAMNENTFGDVLNILCQICGIYDDDLDEEISKLKFKNEKAKRNYLKILKGQKEREAGKRKDKNMSIPNIISAVANKHPSINILNIWDLTVFQLLDAFNRLQANAFYEIDSSRVSTWGDEKKTFDAALWYKNTYDKSLDEV